MYMLMIIKGGTDMKYRMYFAFLDSEGKVESGDNDGVVYCAEVVAKDVYEAIEKIEKQERFKNEVGIIDFEYVKEKGDI